VTTYTITITADHSGATTQLRLDTTGGRTTLTDLHLHDSAGLSTGKLPAIDYPQLLAALNTRTPTPITRAAVPATQPTPGRGARPTANPPARKRTRPATTTRAKAPRPGTGSTTQVASQPAANPRTRRVSAKAATAANKSAPTARKTAKKTATKTAGRVHSGAARAYRRLPDDLAAVYQQLGGATAVADYYQVPRHTANGWLRRLRDQGIIPTTR
jgi:hypothetical protein